VGKLQELDQVIGECDRWFRFGLAASLTVFQKSSECLGRGPGIILEPAVIAGTQKWNELSLSLSLFKSLKKKIIEITA
jgi:hypothetical protein